MHCRSQALRQLILLAILLIGTVVGGKSAWAQKITNCSIANSSIVFSPYNPVTKAAVDSTGDLNISCTGGGSSAKIYIELSSGGSGTCSSRRMNSGSNMLQYQVFTSNALTTVWCGTQRVERIFNFGGDGAWSGTVPMYGRIPSGQNAIPGSYSDSFTAVAFWDSDGKKSMPATVSISGSVPASCSLATTAMSFGNYNPWSGTNATATLGVNCTSGSPYAVSINGGQNLSGSTRRMAGPNSGRLTYQLFSDSSRTSSWGDGTGLGSTVSGTGSGNTQNLTVYGRIPEKQLLPPAGQYSDTVTITVTY